MGRRKKNSSEDRPDLSAAVFVQTIEGSQSVPDMELTRDESIESQNRTRQIFESFLPDASKAVSEPAAKPSRALRAPSSTASRTAAGGKAVARAARAYRSKGSRS